MRSAVFGLALLAFVGPAHAQTQRMAVVAVSGEPTRLQIAYALNPDCTSVGPYHYVLIEAASHGKASFKQTKIFPNYPADNPRSACNKRRVDGTEVTYVSERGFHGSDAVEFESISTLGSSHRVRFEITVR